MNVFGHPMAFAVVTFPKRDSSGTTSEGCITKKGKTNLLGGEGAGSHFPGREYGCEYCPERFFSRFYRNAHHNTQCVSIDRIGGKGELMDPRVAPAKNLSFAAHAEKDLGVRQAALITASESTGLG